MQLFLSFPAHTFWKVAVQPFSGKRCGGVFLFWSSSYLLSSGIPFDIYQHIFLEHFKTFRFLACCDNLLRSSIFKPNSFWHTFYLFQFAHISSFLGNICTHFYLFWANFHTFYIFWANSHISSRVQFAHISFFLGQICYNTYFALLNIYRQTLLYCTRVNTMQTMHYTLSLWGLKAQTHVPHDQRVGPQIENTPRETVTQYFDFFQSNPSTVHLAKELASWRKALLGHLVLTAPSNHQWPTWVATIKY